MRLTITDKKFYCIGLKNLLKEPSFDDIKTAYKLFETEANETNNRKVEKYCGNKNYFRLSLLADKLRWGTDDFGEVPISDFLTLFLLIDKQGQFYMLASTLENRTEKTLPNAKEKVLFIKKAPAFYFKLYFRKSQALL